MQQTSLTKTQPVLEVLFWLKPNRILPELTPQQSARFHRKINHGLPDECWPWTHSRDEAGYGIVRLVVNGKDTPFKAHRMAYFLATKHDPADMCVCHKCDNPPCCNPNHLFLGTNQDNTHDRFVKGRSMRGSSHYFNLRPECVPRGSQHGHSKLTEAQVLEIRQLAGQHSSTELGLRYGVHRRMIDLIVQRKNWTHI